MVDKNSALYKQAKEIQSKQQVGWSQALHMAKNYLEHNEKEEEKKVDQLSTKLQDISLSGSSSSKKTFLAPKPTLISELCPYQTRTRRKKEVEGKSDDGSGELFGPCVAHIVNPIREKQVSELGNRAYDEYSDPDFSRNREEQLEIERIRKLDYYQRRKSASGKKKSSKRSSGGGKPPQIAWGPNKVFEFFN
jgi:hypothetical protein